MTKLPHDALIDRLQGITRNVEARSQLAVLREYGEFILATSMTPEEFEEIVREYAKICDKTVRNMGAIPSILARMRERLPQEPSRAERLISARSWNAN